MASKDNQSEQNNSYDSWWDNSFGSDENSWEETQRNDFNSYNNDNMEYPGNQQRQQDQIPEYWIPQQTNNKVNNGYSGNGYTQEQQNNWNGNQGYAQGNQGNGYTNQYQGQPRSFPSLLPPAPPTQPLSAR